MSASVVVGTGPVGSHITQLTAAGRTGNHQFAGATNVTADATDPQFTTAVCPGADTIYFCLDAPDYHRWPEQFPPLQRGVLTAARAVGARLVVLENPYGYDPAQGREPNESLPLAATSAKGRKPAATTNEVLDAPTRGTVEVAISRASDYFGPDATHSALGEFEFDAALRGQTAEIMGDPDRLHSHSYSPDAAAGLIVLGTDSRATEHVRHHPSRRPGPSATSSSASTAASPRSRECSPPGGPLFACTGSSNRRCASTSTPSTSSPTSTCPMTASGATLGDLSTPLATPWPPPSTGVPSTNIESDSNAEAVATCPARMRR